MTPLAARLLRQPPSSPPPNAYPSYRPSGRVRAHEHPRGGGDLRPRAFAVVSDSNSTTSENARLPIRVLMAHHPYLTREFLTAVCTAAPDVELVAVCSNATELDAAITAWRQRGG